MRARRSKKTAKWHAWFERLPKSRQAEYRRVARARSRKWAKDNGDRFRKNMRRAQLRVYGLTPEDFQGMLRQQGGGCRICGGTNGKKNLAVDHCHETGKVRGLLCDDCNQSIGRMRDDPGRLRRAALYLEGEL